jgi:hypothetical protein
MAACRAGKKLFLQRAFARSDRKFDTREVNRSLTVASDRSGNEIAVNVAKRAGVLQRGLWPNESSQARLKNYYNHIHYHIHLVAAHRCRRLAGQLAIS